MNYSLRQLRIFVTVAQTKSFSQTGDIIGLSRSTVSHSVKELGGQTGVWLLDRTAREMTLTKVGHQLATRLERIPNRLHGTLRKADQVGAQLTGAVCVATNQTISAHLILQCIAQSNQLYPAIGFVLHDRPQWQVLESIHQGKMDFDIMIDPGAVTDLQCGMVLSEPLLLSCREGRPLAQRKWVDWQGLYHKRLVLRDYASGSRPLVDVALARFSTEVNVVQETGRPAILFPMIEMGIGISVLSALMLPLP